MEIFYSYDCSGGVCRLDETESAHCVRVLRHREGEEIQVFDGSGNLYRCRLTDASPKAAQALVLEQIPDWGAVPYRLTMGVCPTKNADRFEWFAEKAVEFGVDRIAPLAGDHSERRTVNLQRLRKILLSAAKQSLKGRVPEVDEICTVKEFIRNANPESLRLIAYCFEEEDARKLSINEALSSAGNVPITILIGPEGDFSREELQLALSNGFLPVHLGQSRLRTETAALAAVAAVYLNSQCS